MAKFKVVYRLKRARKPTESEVFSGVGSARTFAQSVASRSSVVTICRDSESEDHPNNAGKFLLYLIVK